MVGLVKMKKREGKGKSGGALASAVMIMSRRDPRTDVATRSLLMKENKKAVWTVRSLMVLRDARIAKHQGIQQGRLYEPEYLAARMTSRKSSRKISRS